MLQCAPPKSSHLKIIPRTTHKQKNPDGSKTFDLIVITDMDGDSKVESEQWKWRAITRKGKLTVAADKKSAKVEWIEDSDQNVTTGLNYKGRAMELSDLSEYNGHLLSPDDKTGMLYEIKDDEVVANFLARQLTANDLTKEIKAIPWVFLNSGPGNTTKGMKVEWLTIKDNLLYAGGHGAVSPQQITFVFKGLRE
ncbi:Apyrase [Ancylostoma duodenale]|uniref:Apyrase n=1 Tax=Ancylostoma duodenale TaxID=51022 RepID=A0A0C2CQS9_9BILA|nr:Apyrase [Ancylostoma duodenale]